MPIAIAQGLVTLAGVYAALGLVFAVPFVLVGAQRTDPAAEGGTWGFRLLIIPGVIAFWPLLAFRWIGGREQPRERNPHRDAARAQRSTQEDRS